MPQGRRHRPGRRPGNPEKSLLIKAISYKDSDLQMPPKGEKLSEEDITTLTEWITMGAPDPRTSVGKLTGLNDKARSHWAYQPVKKPEVPSVKASKIYIKNEIDNFIVAKLEANGFQPSHLASKEALLRRATYDLTGLPPTTHEVREFLIDSSAKAWERVVDRLLASPHYGERWGRYLARQRSLCRHDRRQSAGQGLPLRLRLDLSRLGHQSLHTTTWRTTSSS